jgi:phosphodiesterase/alkaline phosphatase D-like protein
VHIEVASTESFKEVLQKVWVDALPESDLTAKVAIDGLPSGQDIFYRVVLQNHAESTIVGDQWSAASGPPLAVGEMSLSYGPAIPAARAGAST